MKKFVLLILWVLILGSLYMGFKGKMKENKSEKAVMEKVSVGERVKEIGSNSIKKGFKIKLGNITLYGSGKANKKTKNTEKNQPKKIFTRGSEEDVEKKKESIDYYIMEAEKSLYNGDVKKSIDIISRGIKAWPEEVSGYQIRGSYYMRNRDYKRAIEDYDRIIKIDFTNISAYKGRSSAYYYLRDFENAKGNLLKAIELSPTDKDLIFSLTTVYELLGENESVIKSATRLLDIDKGSLLAYDSRGIAYLRIGENEKALEDFNEIIKSDKGKASAYNNRGMVYIEKERFSDATDDFMKCLELEANYRFVLKDIESYNKFISYLKKDMKTEKEKKILSHMENRERIIFLD